MRENVFVMDDLISAKHDLFCVMSDAEHEKKVNAHYLIRWSLYFTL